MHPLSKIPRFQVHSFIPSFSLSNFRRRDSFLASLLPQRKSHTYAQEVITIFGIQISVQQWRRMGTDHSLQAPQIPSFRNKYFCRHGLGFAFQARNIFVLPWQRHITWPQMVIPKFRIHCSCEQPWSHFCHKSATNLFRSLGIIIESLFYIWNPRIVAIAPQNKFSTRSDRNKRIATQTLLVEATKDAG